MLIKTYFERIYPYIRSSTFYPSRKNSGIFVTLCFRAAGSNHFPFIKGKRYTSGDVPLQRKLYDGNRSMTPEIKASFHLFDVDGLASFYKESIESDKLRDVMLAFGIPSTATVNENCLYRALAIQLQSFVESNTDEANDIAAMEYQKLIEEPQEKKIESFHPVSAFYSGDQIYFSSKPRPTYQVNVYEKFQHTWEFENVGTQMWNGRRLYFFNHDSARPRADKNYVDIPDTPPRKSVKITMSMDARGFVEQSECKWIMIDSNGNDCFPNSGIFTFFIDTKFEFEK